MSFLPDTGSHKPLTFTIWLLADRKKDAAALLVVAAVAAAAVWQSSQSWSFCVFASILLFGSLWSVFVPVRFEINADGILREVFGFRRLIFWDQIRSYRIRDNGIFLLPPNDRFYLEAFRGFFLPVPPQLSAEVLYRFRIFVDKQE